MRSILWCIAMVALLAACQNNEGKNPKKTIQEIPVSKDQLSTADIIRNPVSANKPTDTVNVAKFEFEDTEYDFGAVLEGKWVEHTFKFKNAGKVPLIISDARSTCGCTVPDWPKGPIAPGERSQIHVKFNTTKKTENQVKPVTITANTYPSKTKLTIKGYVKPYP